MAPDWVKTKEQADDLARRLDAAARSVEQWADPSSIRLLLEHRVLKEEEARRWETMTPEEAATPPVLTPQEAAAGWTVRRAIDEFFLGNPQLSRTTQSSYSSILEGFARFCRNGKMPVTEAFDGENLRSFARYRAAVVKADKRSRGGQRALNNDRQTLSSLASWLVGEGVLFENRVRASLAYRRETRKERTVLTTEQATALIATASAYSDPAGRSRTDYGLLIRFLLETGLRSSELRQLDWSDLKGLDNPGGHTEVVVAAKPQRGWTPKSYAERVIPISEELAVLLAEQKSRLPSHFRADEAPVFPYGYKAPRRYSVLRTFLRTIWEAAFPDNDPPYDGAHPFRHTAAVRWLTPVANGGAGLSAVEVKRLLGHSNLATTNIYLDHVDHRSWRAQVRSRLVGFEIGEEDVGLGAKRLKEAEERREATRKKAKVKREKGL
ncbi:MAG: tyrosine-type recombinase/integrase [Sumerlaeia bacterium]